MSVSGPQSNEISVFQSEPTTKQKTEGQLAGHAIKSNPEYKRNSVVPSAIPAQEEKKSLIDTHKVVKSPDDEAASEGGCWSGILKAISCLFSSKKVEITTRTVPISSTTITTAPPSSPTPSVIPSSVLQWLSDRQGVLPTLNNSVNPVAAISPSILRSNLRNDKTLLENIKGRILTEENNMDSLGTVISSSSKSLLEAILTSLKNSDNKKILKEKVRESVTIAVSKNPQLDDFFEDEDVPNPEDLKNLIINSFTEELFQAIQNIPTGKFAVKLGEENTRELMINRLVATFPGIGNCVLKKDEQTLSGITMLEKVVAGDSEEKKTTEIPHTDPRALCSPWVHGEDLGKYTKKFNRVSEEPDLLIRAQKQTQLAIKLKDSGGAPSLVRNGLLDILLGNPDGHQSQFMQDSTTKEFMNIDLARMAYPGAVGLSAKVPLSTLIEFRSDIVGLSDIIEEALGEENEMVWKELQQQLGEIKPDEWEQNGFVWTKSETDQMADQLKGCLNDHTEANAIGYCLTNLPAENDLNSDKSKEFLLKFCGKYGVTYDDSSDANLKKTRVELLGALKIQLQTIAAKCELLITDDLVTSARTLVNTIAEKYDAINLKAQSKLLPIAVEQTKEKLSAIQTYLNARVGEHKTENSAPTLQGLFAATYPELSELRNLMLRWTPAPVLTKGCMPALQKQEGRELSRLLVIYQEAPDMSKDEAKATYEAALTTYRNKWYEIIPQTAQSSGEPTATYQDKADKKDELMFRQSVEQVIIEAESRGVLQPDELEHFCQLRKNLIAKAGDPTYTLMTGPL